MIVEKSKRSLWTPRRYFTIRKIVLLLLICLLTLIATVIGLVSMSKNKVHLSLFDLLKRLQMRMRSWC